MPINVFLLLSVLFILFFSELFLLLPLVGFPLSPLDQVFVHPQGLLELLLLLEPLFFLLTRHLFPISLKLELEPPLFVQGSPLFFLAPTPPVLHLGVQAPQILVFLSLSSLVLKVLCHS